MRFGFYIYADLATLGFQKGENPTREEISKRRRELAILYHPDKHLDQEAKEKNQEKLKLINAAYDRLKKLDD